MCDVILICSHHDAGNLTSSEVQSCVCLTEQVFNPCRQVEVLVLCFFIFWTSCPSLCYTLLNNHFQLFRFLKRESPNFQQPVKTLYKHAVVFDTRQSVSLTQKVFVCLIRYLSQIQSFLTLQDTPLLVAEITTVCVCVCSIWMWISHIMSKFQSLSPSLCLCEHFTGIHSQMCYEWTCVVCLVVFCITEYVSICHVFTCSCFNELFKSYTLAALQVELGRRLQLWRTTAVNKELKMCYNSSWIWHVYCP